MRHLISLLALALLVSPSLAQQKTRLTGPRANADVIELDVGQYHLFEIPVGTFDKSKPYSVTCESRDTVEAATYFNVIPSDPKIEKSLVIFATDDSPINQHLIIISDNAIVYRALVTVHKRPLPPRPSPYTQEIKMGFALDSASADDLAQLSAIFDRIGASLNAYAKGSDVWQALDQQYARLTDSTKNTRYSISLILLRVTGRFYDTQLSASDRKLLKQFFADLKSACDELATGPKPPTPGPTPPTPGPSSNPFGGGGLHVLIVYDSKAVTPEIDVLLRSGALRDYLNTHADKNNGAPEWRIFPTTEDVSNEAKIWQDAFKRDRKSTPWIVIGKDQAGFEGELPAKLDDLLALIKKYGGA